MNLIQRAVYNTLILGLRLYRKLTVEVRVWGRERIPQGAKLYVSNHISSQEIFLTTLFPEPVHVIVGPACKYRIVAWLCKHLEQINAMPAHRQTVVPEGIMYLERGGALFLNPEGDFCPTFEMGRFYPGVARMYRATRAPVVPIAVLTPRSSLHLKKSVIEVEGRVYKTLVIKGGPYCVHFGEPFCPEVPAGTDVEQDEAVLDQIKRRIEELVEETRTKTFWLEKCERL